MKGGRKVQEVPAIGLPPAQGRDTQQIPYSSRLECAIKLLFCRRRCRKMTTGRGEDEVEEEK